MNKDTNSQGVEPVAAASDGGGPEGCAQHPSASADGSDGPEAIYASLAEVRAELAETRRILDSLKAELAAGGGSARIPSGAMSPRVADSGASRLSAAAKAASHAGDRNSLMAYLRLRRATG